MRPNPDQTEVERKVIVQDQNLIRFDSKILRDSHDRSSGPIHKAERLAQMPVLFSFKEQCIVNKTFTADRRAVQQQIDGAKPQVVPGIFVLTPGIPEPRDQLDHKPTTETQRHGGCTEFIFFISP